MTVVLERCVDNINTRIAYADFISMRTVHKVFPLSKTIHLNQITKKGDYVTPTKFDGNLEVRMKAYHDSHKAYPAAIWTVKAPVTPVVTKPTLILELESALGGVINNIEDWIGLLIAHGVYDHYNCMKYMTFATIQKYGIKLAINRIRNGGLNCADYTALTVQVLEALALMGVKYEYQINHVYCNSSNGRPDSNAGHFLLTIKINGVWVDVDPAEAAGGKRGIGHNMCYYNFNRPAGIVGHTLC
jgi:hypothetical protein